MIMNDTLERMLKEEVGASSEVLLHHLPAQSDENHERL
jgi:hypothetical protein